MYANTREVHHHHTPFIPVRSIFLFLANSMNRPLYQFLRKNNAKSFTWFLLVHYEQTIRHTNILKYYRLEGWSRWGVGVGGRSANKHKQATKTLFIFANRLSKDAAQYASSGC